MGATKMTRSQQGARAEARRRIAERARLAEAALTDFLRAEEQIEAARKQIEAHQAAQRQALSDLAEVLGPGQAAAAAGVDVKDVRPAGAGNKVQRTGDQSPLPHA